MQNASSFQRVVNPQHGSRQPFLLLLSHLASSSDHKLSPDILPAAAVQSGTSLPRTVSSGPLSHKFSLCCSSPVLPQPILPSGVCVLPRPRAARSPAALCKGAVYLRDVLHLLLFLPHRGLQVQDLGFHVSLPLPQLPAPVLRRPLRALHLPQLGFKLIPHPLHPGAAQEVRGQGSEVRFRHTGRAEGPGCSLTGSLPPSRTPPGPRWSPAPASGWPARSPYPSP